MVKHEPSQPRVLVLEPVLKHWTTVEPLALLFLRRGWAVTVVSPRSMRPMLERYVNPQESTTDLRFVVESTRNLAKVLLWQAHDCVIMSNRWINTKTLKWTPGSFLRQCLTKWILYTFFSFRAGSSYLIISSHLVRGVSEYSAKTDSRTLGLIGKWVWNAAIRKTRAINVYSSLVRDSMSELTDKPILVAPNAIFRNSNEGLKQSSSEKLSIVVPGRIDRRRRYYEWIDEIPPDLREHLSITLLGIAQTDEDQQVIEKFEGLGFAQPPIVTGTFISFEDFDSAIESADLLLAPLRPLQSRDSSVDRNSGSFHDAVRYGKLILTPQHAPVDKALSGNAMSYKDDPHLALLLRRLLEDRAFRERSVRRAFENSLQFAVERLSYVDELTALMQSTNR